MYIAQGSITKYCAHLHHTLAAMKRHLLVAPLPNSEQINHPFSNHTYTMSTLTHIHHHYASFVTHTHTLSLQLHPHRHHVVTPGFMDKPRQCDETTVQMDGEAGWWTWSGKIGLPPLARVKGAFYEGVFKIE